VSDTDMPRHVGLTANLQVQALASIAGVRLIF